MKNQETPLIFTMRIEHTFLVYESDPLREPLVIENGLIVIKDKHVDMLNRRIILKIHHMMDINGEHALIEPLIPIEDLPGLFDIVAWWGEDKYEGPNIYNPTLERVAIDFLHKRVPPPNRMFLLESFKEDGITDVNDWIGMMKINKGVALGDECSVDVIDGREQGDNTDYWGYLDR